MTVGAACSAPGHRAGAISEGELFRWCQRICYDKRLKKELGASVPILPLCRLAGLNKQHFYSLCHGRANEQWRSRSLSLLRPFVEKIIRGEARFRKQRFGPWYWQDDNDSLGAGPLRLRDLVERRGSPEVGPGLGGLRTTGTG